MKKFILTTAAILCGFLFSASAQSYIKIDTSFYSETLDEVKNVDIYLPGDYYLNPEQKYATIYYLHGAGGNQNSGYGNAVRYYIQHDNNTAITSPAAIFVCPDGSCSPYSGSMYVNSELYGDYEDYIMYDIIEFVDSNYRTNPDKFYRMITGASMGGFGSSYLGVKYPDKFRASFPYIGFLAIPDTLLNTWKDLYYEEHGNYLPTTSGGANTQLLLTMCGGVSPNLDNPPTYVDFPFDTTGNWVDTILVKWYEFDASSMVKNLPDENELAWFLGCGTTDYMCTYPTYLQFMDSLEFYGIDYDYDFFEGGHIFNPETWMKGMIWMDSIINQSYLAVGISQPKSDLNQVSIYPNPVKERATIEFAGNISKLEIISASGRTQRIEEPKSQNQQVTLDLSNLPPGIYFLRLQAGNEMVVKKVVKL